MAKSGLKIGTPANGKTNITGTQLKKDMNVQASSQKRMAQASRLNLNTDSPRQRKFVMMIIDGASVKRYL
jgi:hypothetical protein